MTEMLLDIDDVTVTFGGGVGQGAPFTALEDFTLTIPADKPEIIAIAGESGSGKSTMGGVALGLNKPTKGSVRFLGSDVWQTGMVHSPDYRRSVQAIFQDPFSVFNPFYPVERLMRMPLTQFGIAKNRTEQDELIGEALSRVGLRPEQIIGRHPHQLSGGQRQRIVVARALMLRPKLIVADEPVSMIDASLRATVLENLRSLRDDHGISLIYITHDLATARQVSDRLFVLYRGRAVEEGTALDVIGSPCHPYTQLLMNSIPRPDPDLGWHGESIGDEARGPLADRSACVFIDRCPTRIDACHRQPRQRRVGGSRVACHLFESSDAL